MLSEGDEEDEEGDLTGWEIDELVEERCGTRSEGVVVDLLPPNNGLLSTAATAGCPASCRYELSNHGLKAVLFGIG